MIRIVVLALAFSLALPTHAQESGKKQAEALFRAGEKAFNASQYAAAAQAFEEAMRLYSSPAIGFSAAQAYRLQYFVDRDPRHLKRAVELYRAYLDAVPAGGRRADAVAALAEIEPIALRLEAETAIESGTPLQTTATKLMVTASVEDAKVRIGDEPAEALPLARDVAPGKYRIRVERDGYFSFDESREVFAGQFRVVEVELRPRPAQVTVRADDGATIQLDGRTLGTAPLTSAIDVEAGAHWFAFSQRGKKPQTRELDLGRGQTATITVDLESTLQRKMSYIVFGLAGASLLTSGGFALAAASADGDASDLLDLRERENRAWTPAEQLRYESLRGDRDDRLRSSFVFLGAGAAIGLGGALLFYFDQDSAERPSESPTLTPMTSRDAVGATLSGAF